jgi:hypothetical protein
MNLNINSILHKSLMSVCDIGRQQLSNNITMVMNTHNNIIIVGGVVFYVVCVVSKERGGYLFLELQVNIFEKVISYD